MGSRSRCGPFLPVTTLAKLSLGAERATNQQVRRLPQTGRRMVAIPSDRNLRRWISLSSGEIAANTAVTGAELQRLA